ncbi:MAG: trypsin-like serine protease [Actinomycetales bacterium]|nr:trypsin-like serine protease [Actinomycetales bacterium]
MALCLPVSSPALAQGAPSPRVMGGTPAVGDRVAAAIIMREGDSWPKVCTAVLWKPRVLLTAAHCVTKSGTSANVDGVKAFPPGVEIQAYSNIQPNASPIAVTGIVRPDGYVNAGTQVSPNDIAAIVLASDLAPTAVTRLATRVEVERMAQQAAPATMIGYGQAGPGVQNSIPNAVSFPVTRLWLGAPLGDVFLARTSNGQDACPGDSGAPVLATGGSGTLLLGNQAGASGPCFGRPEGATVNFLAMGYLPMLNAALAQAGYAPIPGPPGQPTATARNREVIITWQAPAIAPQAVIGYDVLDASGASVCMTATTTCTIPKRPDGTYAYTVRSRNADGEGDAAVSTSAVVAGPTRLAAPWAAKATGSRAGRAGRVVVRFHGLGRTSSAVVTRYLVRDQRGRIVCTITGRQARAKVPSCTLAKRSGKARLRVRAVTEMGTTRWSPPSRPIILG